MANEFSGTVTISAQGLYDLLREHIEDDPAAAIVIGLQTNRSDQQVEAAPVELPAAGEGKAACYANVENGMVIRVNRTDESYAYMSRIDGKGHWAMPIAEYRSDQFARAWRPATAEEVIEATGALAVR